MTYSLTIEDNVKNLYFYEMDKEYSDNIRLFEFFSALKKERTLGVLWLLPIILWITEKRIR